MADEQTEDTATAKRGRGPAKPKRQRRSFAAELSDLQSRVSTAVRLLRRATKPTDGALDGAADADLVQVAIEELEGTEP